MPIDTILRWVATVFVIVTVVTLIPAVVRARQNGTGRGMLLAISIITLVALGGAAWTELSLRSFAGGNDIRGVIAHPIPNTTDHEFTEHGGKYLLWSFGVPVCVTIGLLVTATLVGAVALIRRRSALAGVAVGLYACTVTIAVGAYWLRRFVLAVDLFV